MLYRQLFTDYYNVVLDIYMQSCLSQQRIQIHTKVCVYTSVV